MPRLFVNLDPVVAARAVGGSDVPDPVAALVIAENAGVDGTVVSYKEQGGATTRDLRLLRGVRKTIFAIEVPFPGESLSKSLEAAPDRIVLRPVHTEEWAAGAGSMDSWLDAVADAVERVHDANVSPWVRVAPDVRDLKAAARQRIDGLVFDARRLTEARTGDEAVEALEAVEHLSVIARKFNMGVTIAGGLDRRAVGHLAEIPQVGEVIVGHALWARALFVGVERAVSEFASACRP